MLKVNNKNTRRRRWHCSGAFILLTQNIFNTFSSVLVGDFEQEIVSWEVANTALISGANSLPSKL